MNLRALPLGGILVFGCFASAPTLETDTAVATDVADSTDGPMCEADEVVLPSVPDGWDGPAWVAIGTPGGPPTSCPEATVPETMFLGTPPSPQCACACDPETVCGTTHSVGNGCDGVIPRGGVNLCTDVPQSSDSIDLSVTPLSTSCAPTPQPFAAGATPVHVCSIAGAGDGCEPAVTGFLGPCIVGSADACPAGFNELVSEATAFVCGQCSACESGKYCDHVRYELYGEPGCAGMPIDSVTPDANCLDTGMAFASLRAVEVPRLDTGCDPTTADTQSRRVCCLPS